MRLRFIARNAGDFVRESANHATTTKEEAGAIPRIPNACQPASGMAMNNVIVKSTAIES